MFADLHKMEAEYGEGAQKCVLPVAHATVTKLETLHLQQC